MSIAQANFFKHLDTCYILMYHHVSLSLTCVPTIPRISLYPFTILLYHISNAFCHSVWYSHCSQRKNYSLYIIEQQCPCSAILMCSRNTSKLIIKQVIKLRGFAWEQYWHIAPLNLWYLQKPVFINFHYWILINICTCIAHNVSKHFLSLNYAKLSQYTIFHWIMKSTNYI